MNLTLHELLDCHFGENGDDVLREQLEAGEDPNAVSDHPTEMPIHVATRRRRKEAVAILLDHGAEIDALNGHGKTAYAHAIRRGFDEVAELLAERGANTHLNAADQFAVAIVNGNFEEARKIFADNPTVAKTGNPEEDRLLADVAGRNEIEPVRLLIEMGADLSCGALDGGTALHQTAWFGQPQNARLLIDAGAPLDDFNNDHTASPLHWAVHGSRYSGGAEERQEIYVELVEMLLAAGSSLHYPGDPDSDDYKKRLMNDATPQVKDVLAKVIKFD